MHRELAASDTLVPSSADRGPSCVSSGSILNRSAVMQATRPPSRIGMGRQSAVSSTPPAASTAAAGAIAPQTTPLAGASGIPFTPSSFQTALTANEQQQQEQLPAQKGHPAATPVFNISPATAAEQAGPIPSITTSTSTSKWKSGAASSSSGPVFSVVSRGNRITAGHGHTPPPPPAKANSTIARTANRLHGRSTSSTSPSGSSIGLRGERTTPSTLSSSSSGPAARAFGSRIGTGRFGDGSSSTASSTRSCTTPLISNTSCKSVARTLSFDESADSPKSTTPGISSSKSLGAAAKPKAGLAGKPPAGAAHGLATAASMDDVEHSLHQLDQLANNSSDSRIWLSGANNSTDGSRAASCIKSPFAGLEQPPAADLLGMPSQLDVADLAAVEALLPSVRDAASSQAAARALVQQLVRSADSLTAAAGLHGDTAMAAVLGSTASTATEGGSLQDSLQDTIQVDQEADKAAQGSGSGGDHSNSFGGVLLGQAARMLQAGASVQQVRQAVMPALLLQLASLAAGSSSGASSGSKLSGAQAAAAALGGDGEAGSAAQVVEAAGLLAAGLQAGLAAAKAAVEGTAGFPASSSTSSSGDLAKGGSAARKSSAVGNLVLLLWSSLLLVVGFVAAAVLSVLEGEAMLGGGIGSSAAGGAGVGFCGVGPGGAYGVAAELCGGLGVGVGVGWQQQAGADMQDWGAAAVQHGRRFGA